jgi:hypothetical protein
MPVRRSIAEALLEAAVEDAGRGHKHERREEHVRKVLGVEVDPEQRVGGGTEEDQGEAQHERRGAQRADEACFPRFDVEQ